ncbi:MAG: hypothetical protein ABWZ79_22295 [Pedobacter agri]
MSKLLLTATSIILLFNSVFSQTIEDLPALNIGFRPYDTKHLALFDTNEIKGRKIKTAFIANVSGKRDIDGNWENKDTCLIYNFDENGNVKDTGKQSTYYNKRRVYSISGPKKDSTLTEYVLERFQKGLDTALIVKSRYKAGNLVEYEVIPTDLFNKEIGCRSGEPPYRYKYNYDDENRMVLDSNLITKESIRILYTPYGEHHRYYDGISNRPVRESVILIDSTTFSKTITSSTASIAITYFEEHSKLAALITIFNRSMSPAVTHYQIFYQ